MGEQARQREPCGESGMGKWESVVDEVEAGGGQLMLGLSSPQNDSEFILKVMQRHQVLKRSLCLLHGEQIM